jgi:hypothetical protein
VQRSINYERRGPVKRDKPGRPPVLITPASAEAVALILANSEPDTAERAAKRLQVRLVPLRRSRRGSAAIIGFRRTPV